MSIAFKWHLLEDLPDSWPKLASSELPSLASVWKDRSKSLRKSGALTEFNDRLRREWAIETGIIEHLYVIDRGTTTLLIEKGIEASLIPHGSTDKAPEEVVAILRDHEDVLEGIFDFVVQRRPLSVSYIKELHQAFTRHQSTVTAVNGLGRVVDVPLHRGDWKRIPNNPVRPDHQLHEYCPPEHVASEMDRLVEFHLKHVQNKIPAEIEAAWLHHRFTQIHPFQDGNGRVARALASLVFLRVGWFPLVINRDRREEYIRALETADQGELEPLISLFANIQKNAFVHALSVSDDVLHGQEAVEQLVHSAAERLRARRDAKLKEREKVFEVSRELEHLTYQRLKTLAAELTTELRLIDSTYSARALASTGNSDHWFRTQIIETARKLGYFADTRTYRQWVKLRIREERQADLVFSFHALGVEFLGSMAVSAFMEFRDKDEETRVQVGGPYQASSEVFQFSYNEDKQRVILRFEKWLNQALIAGLDQWRRQL